MPQTIGLREAKKMQTWRALHAAAVDLVGRDGFDAMSLDDVAAAAHVSRSTLFNYFDSKEALLLDPEPGSLERWREAAERVADVQPSWRALEELVLDCIGWDEAQMHVRRNIIDHSSVLVQSARTASEPFRRFIREWVASRLGGDTFRAVLMAHSAIGILYTSYTSWDPGSGKEGFHRLVRDGFAAIGAGLDREHIPEEHIADKEVTA